jgi:hypothetical protein
MTEQRPEPMFPGMALVFQHSANLPKVTLKGWRHDHGTGTQLLASFRNEGA